MTQPLVSIIIPLYNAQNYIVETITSAMNQTWPNKEIIIIDDGSTDNSLALAKGFENDYIKVYTQKNSGASAARNKGLAECKGDYIQFLDADDLLSADKIASQVVLLSNDKNTVASCATVFFNDGDDIAKKQPAHQWHYKNADDNVQFLLNLYGGPGYAGITGGMVTIHSWLTPRAIIEKAGPWNEMLTVDDDGEYFCRVLLAADGVKFSPQGINYYRKFEKPRSLSAQKSKQAYQSMLLSTDLKYQHLKNKTDTGLLKSIFSRYYWEIGVACFPQFIKLSNLAIQKAKQYGYNGPKYLGGDTSTLLSRILGWRLLRIISFIRYGF